MKNTIKKYFLNALVLLFTFVVLFSCTNMDDGYKAFIKNGEISYSGTIENLTILSGKNRVEVKGDLLSDPKITEVRVFWNSRKESIVVPIPSIPYALDVIIDKDSQGNPLQENIYNFEVITYDKLGNKSLAVASIGKVYGDLYKSSLINRPVKTTTLVGNKLTLNFTTMDTSSGVQSTDITYISSIDGLEKTINVPYSGVISPAIAPPPGIVTDYKPGTVYSYRTIFRPDPTCIDVFSSEPTTGIKP